MAETTWDDLVAWLQGGSSLRNAVDKATGVQHSTGAPGPFSGYPINSNIIPPGVSGRGIMPLGSSINDWANGMINYYDLNEATRNWLETPEGRAWAKQHPNARMDNEYTYPGPGGYR